MLAAGDSKAWKADKHPACDVVKMPAILLGKGEIKWRGRCLSISLHYSKGVISTKALGDKRVAELTTSSTIISGSCQAFFPFREDR